MKHFLGFLLVLTQSITVLPQDKGLPPAQFELVNAERAFAKLASERGFRESFMTYFADDGIGFAPHPHKLKESLSRQPAPTTNTPMGLKWAPTYGDVSQAGDLGWNAGPVLFENSDPANKPTKHALFFSIWKKQSDGNWRVVLDLGSDTPAAVVPLTAPFQTSYRALGKQRAINVNVAEEIAGLLKVEREVLEAARVRSIAHAYQEHLSDDARVHRPGAMPVVGKEALRGWLSQQTMTLTGEPIKADVSRSGDLGYAYGKYELGGTRPLKGYYVHVWKRDRKGQWRIVMDTINPVPAVTQRVLPPDDLAPQNALARTALAHYKAQEWIKAAEAYGQYLAENPNDSGAWHRLGTSQIYLQQYSQAIKSLEQAVKVGGGVALDFYNLACAYAKSGQTEKALDNIEKAINAGFTNQKQYETDTDLESLRDNQRFKALMKRLS